MAKKKKLNTVDLNRFSAKSVSEESKLIRVKVLIVCEGEKTEPNYFRSFSQIANGSGYVYDVTTEGGGINTLWVVDKAAELKKKAESIGQPYDTVWAVFDKDSFLDQNFDNAVAKARQLGIGYAWSNEAFELWYVLHFDSRCTAMSRKGVYLVRLNSDYVRGNELDLQQLFHITDMSELVAEESAVVEQKVAAAQYMLKQSTPPCIEIGKQCKKPYLCGFFDYCRGELPENSVFELYRLSFAKKLELFKEGKVTISQLDREDARNMIQHIQLDTYLIGEEIDKEGIRNFLNSKIHYPLYFLDFETSQYPVPQFKGSKPYQQIPFQYSLHWIEEEGGELKHTEFLGDGVTDPRRALAEQLVQDIPLGACTTAYNKGFECGRIEEMANLYSDLHDHLMDIHDHISDFLDPFRQGYFYKESMHGSFSIKKVLPALFPDDPELDYHNLTGGVQNGGDAMTIYPKMGKMTPEEREKTRRALLDYCDLDTYAMVKVWEKLVEVSEK